MAENSTTDLKQYKINIKGHQFTVSSQYSEEHIKQVEAFLVQKLDDVAAKSDTYNLMSLTVLVALNLADDLLTIQNNKNYIADSAKESLLAIVDRLDTIVDKNKIPHAS